MVSVGRVGRLFHLSHRRYRSQTAIILMVLLVLTVLLPPLCFRRSSALATAYLARYAGHAAILLQALFRALNLKHPAAKRRNLKLSSLIIHHLRRRPRRRQKNAKKARQNGFFCLKKLGVGDILYNTSEVSGGLIAQSAEHRPFKAVVPGSSPGQPTTFFSSRCEKTGFFEKKSFPRLQSWREQLYYNSVSRVVRRWNKNTCSDGGTGRRVWLRSIWSNPWGFKSPLEYHFSAVECKPT